MITFVLDFWLSHISQLYDMFQQTVCNLFCARLRLKIYDGHQSARYVTWLPDMPPVFCVCLSGMHSFYFPVNEKCYYKNSCVCNTCKHDTQIRNCWAYICFPDASQHILPSTSNYPTPQKLPFVLTCIWTSEPVWEMMSTPITSSWVSQEIPR